MKRRKSTQREKIYNMINCSSSHPTAFMIYDELRKEIPSISLGNVYRNIKILLEQGRIISKDLDGIEHYDAVIVPHYHFICEICKGITDFDLPVQKNILKKAQKITKHEITNHTIHFYGICDKCKKIKKGEN